MNAGYDEYNAKSGLDWICHSIYSYLDYVIPACIIVSRLRPRICTPPRSLNILNYNYFTAGRCEAAPPRRVNTLRVGVRSHLPAA